MKKLEKYIAELERRNLSPVTIKKYAKDIRDFLEHVDGRKVDKKVLDEYKEHLMGKYKISTVNNKVTIINNYLKFAKSKVSMSLERTQKSGLSEDVLTEDEFNRLIRIAKKRGKVQMEYLMLTLYRTGIRISELKFLTVDALKKKQMEINNKGKHRVVPLAPKLVKDLKTYCKMQEIEEGVIFRTSTGKPVDRSNVFRELKWIAGQARIKKAKVYPHSFRHLFAKQWLKHNNNNNLELANILGHSSLDTTRIYASMTVSEQRETINF